MGHADETSLGADATRRADHAGIARLADELLPSLIAKLGASGLGEIELREGDWHVRLRRPADASVAVRQDRRPGDRAARSQPGHVGHGHAPAAVESHHGTGQAGHEADGQSPREVRHVATSPAVGVFQPRPKVGAGTKILAGDRLGHVDLLGVPQEVVSPVDGIVGASLVQPGQAVEYGQELIVIELTAPTPAAHSDPSAPSAASTPAPASTAATPTVASTPAPSGGRS